ncbi:hypothetical protein J3F83DRAFT_456642 [Trichoderma novae-zelandiae]
MGDQKRWGLAQGRLPKDEAPQAGQLAALLALRRAMMGSLEGNKGQIELWRRYEMLCIHWPIGSRHLWVPFGDGCRNGPKDDVLTAGAGEVSVVECLLRRERACMHVDSSSMAAGCRTMRILAKTVVEMVRILPLGWEHCDGLVRREKKVQAVNDMSLFTESTQRRSLSDVVDLIAGMVCIHLYATLSGQRTAQQPLNSQR